MRVFKNLFGNGSKIAASEIAVSKGNLVSDALKDTGWVTVEFQTPFKTYQDDVVNNFVVRKIGNIVYFRGQAENTEIIPAGQQLVAFSSTISTDFIGTTKEVVFPKM